MSGHRIVGSLERGKEVDGLGPRVFSRFRVMPFPRRPVKRMSCIRIQIEIDALLVFC